MTTELRSALLELHTQLHNQEGPDPDVQNPRLSIVLRETQWEAIEEAVTLHLNTNRMLEGIKLAARVNGAHRELTEALGQLGDFIDQVMTNAPLREAEADTGRLTL